MATLVLAARLFLAGVFATAGVAKLLDRSGTRNSLTEFGLGGSTVPVVAVLLPAAELATATALVPASTAQWGGVAALVLLAGFIGGIANALRRGEAPDCHCFGQLHSAPAGRETLARNAGLATLAVVVTAAGPGPSVSGWISDRTAAELVAIAAGVLAVALGAFAARLWRERRALRERLDEARAELAALPAGLPVGATAPEFSLPDLTGETRTLASFLERGRPTALVFISPDCGPCKRLLPELGWWQEALRERLTIAAISRGTAAENQTAAQEHGIADVVLQEDSELLESYRIRNTPSAVIISAEGRIATTATDGLVTIEPLLRLTLSRDQAFAGADARAMRPSG